jgi:hypothetical protein
VVTVSPPPVVAINGNDSICIGFSTTLQATASSGSTYLWSTGETTASITVNPLTNTTYYVQVTDASGCIGFSEIYVEVKQPSAATETVNECESYAWNGNTYNQSGTYTWTGTNAAGCDSVVTLNLTIFEKTTSTIEVNTCGPYEWNGAVYSKSGAYNHVNGCASQTLLLHINEITEVNAQIFSGETYLFNGDVYAESGVYFDTISVSSNCDSIVRLNLIVNDCFNEELNIENTSLCFGESSTVQLAKKLSVFTLKIESNRVGKAERPSGSNHQLCDFNQELVVIGLILRAQFVHMQDLLFDLLDSLFCEFDGVLMGNESRLKVLKLLHFKLDTLQIALFSSSP